MFSFSFFPSSSDFSLFTDEILGFQIDQMVEVRKFLAGFIEASCSKDEEFFTKLIVNLNVALNDSSPHVVKKGIQVATNLYRKFLEWLPKATYNEILESTYEVWSNIKKHIFNLLEISENDGVRTHCIKFMEMVIIAQTKRDQWSNPDEFSLDMIANCKLVNIEAMENEAHQVFEQLIIYHGTPHISSINLMATMQSLVAIARQRSELFLPKVIQALEALHANLPPTLAKSQVTSVRKQLKVQLSLLLRHPVAACNPHYQAQIVLLLNDLGSNQSEINKCIQEVRKRGIKVDQVHIEPKPKRIKLEAEEVQKEKPFEPAPIKVTRNDAYTAIDLTAEDLELRLQNKENVCDLVLVSLLSLPDTMPDHFQATYTPVASAGTSSQIKHLSRLISTQLTAIGIGKVRINWPPNSNAQFFLSFLFYKFFSLSGKGVEEMVSRVASAARAKKAQGAEQSQQQLQKIATVVSRSIASEIKKQEQTNVQIPEQHRVKLKPVGKTLSGSLKEKKVDFAALAKPLSEEEKVKIIGTVISKIIHESWPVSRLDDIDDRDTILTHLATQFQGHSFNTALLVVNYAFEDLANRVKILFTLMFNEYMEATLKKSGYTFYDRCVSTIMNHIIEKACIKDRDKYLPSFYIDAPLITLEMISILKNFILLDSPACDIGFTILQTLVDKRIPNRSELLDVLLYLSINTDRQEVRSNAIRTIRQLYEKHQTVDVRSAIEKFACNSLHRLLESLPFPDQEEILWNEDSIKTFLLPYLCLLPFNHKLIHELAVVYVSTNPDIKRVILRVLDAPVKGMGMNSPELLLLVETCPKGAETLVTRIIHVLTDKHPPSAELVLRVRDLYQKRVPDVRFLIPVLNGLTKREVIAALPKLIKLNPIVVKEVFNRLLGPQSMQKVFHVKISKLISFIFIDQDSGQNTRNPLTASELLVALHNIDPSKCDMKTVMKGNFV